MPPCSICLKFDRLYDHGNRWQVGIRDDLRLEYSLEFDFQKLMQSAQSGCATCSIVLNGLQLMSRKLFILDDLESQPRHGRFILQAESPLEVEVVDAQKNERVRIQYYTLAGSKSSSYAVFITTNHALDGQWAPFGAARDVPSDISAAECSPIILEWITNCQKSHKACAVRRCQLTDPPSRMLDVGLSGDVSEVRLIQIQTQSGDGHGSFSHGPTGPYATLSHCWGSVNVLLTTRETLAQRMRGIDWETLPKTFQDAITIVRALHIRFIWIDSLCIIQDDELDWKSESARMAAIYSNSYINIAATGASDSRGGCLSPRNLKRVSSTFEIASLPIEPAHSPSDELQATPVVFVRPSFESIHHRYSTRKTYDTDLPDAKAIPLLSRAWVYQERYLAPRTLHFHPSEMVMECKSKLRCECTGLDDFIPRSRRKSLDLGPNTLDDRTTLDYWFEVVEEFSRLRLTRESDRLPALIGVATVFQASLKCGYLAGLWEKDIARGLLWDVSRYENASSHVRRHKRSTAPSWSWASMSLETEGAGIIFPAGHDESFKIDSRFAYINTDMPLEAMDSNFGTPNKEIRIRGAVVTAICCAGCEANGEANDEANDEENDEENALTILFEQEVNDAILITSLGMNLDAIGHSQEHTFTENGSTVHCILIGSKTEAHWTCDDQVTYLCTCVLKMPTSVSDHMERIGVLDIRDDTGIFDGAQEMASKLM
ncbi:heterokaryon incompatibility protein-domain-containing protein [Halenospora varia]|nr:heterokaryon incompatibility protein-domain-containing protein [Halenospora varia]